MAIVQSCERIVAGKSRRGDGVGAMAALALALWLPGCAPQPASVATAPPAATAAPVAQAAPATPAAPAPVVQAIPFPDAVLAAATTVFSTAPRGAGAARQ